MSASEAHLSHPKYRPDIDGLRAVAVLSVVIFHAFPSSIKGGFIGVDIFFVISGFLISTIIFENLDRGTFSFGEFYMRRVRRIFPGLLLILIASYAFGWFSLLADEFMQLGKHVAGGAGFVANLVLWSEAGYFDKSAETKPLLHLWSLGIEEQFYIVWPVVLWVAWKRKFNLLTITILVGLISYYLNIHNVRQDATGTFYAPQRRFWELLCGSLLAWLTLYRRESFAGFSAKLDHWLAAAIYRDPREADGRTLASVLSFTGLLLLVYGFSRIDEQSHFPGSWALVPVVGAVLMICAGPKAWLNRHVLANKFVVWFGLISFPLYLWHWPVLSFMRIVRGGTPPTGARVAAVLLAILLAWLTYRFIEKPIRHGGNGLAKTGAMASAMLVMGGVGYFTFAQQGLEQRFPPEIQALAKVIDFQWKENVRYEKCHLELLPPEKRDASCFENKKPSWVLWGDSHASSLYPGLHALQAQHDFGLTQVTQGACPPVLRLDKVFARIDCNAVNDGILKSMEAHPPAVLIMHAAWLFEGYPITNEALYQKLTATLTEVKSRLPGTRVILIGPMPRWRDSPQKVAFQYWRTSVDKTRAMPDFLPAVFIPEVEAVVERSAREQGVEYVSPVQQMCKDKLCRARVGAKPEEFVAIDYGHLSRAGSEYFVKLLEPRLFGQ